MAIVKLRWDRSATPSRRQKRDVSASPYRRRRDGSAMPYQSGIGGSFNPGSISARLSSHVKRGTGALPTARGRSGGTSFFGGTTISVSGGKVGIFAISVAGKRDGIATPYRRRGDGSATPNRRRKGIGVLRPTSGGKGWQCFALPAAGREPGGGKRWECYALKRRRDGIIHVSFVGWGETWQETYAPCPPFWCRARAANC